MASINEMKYNACHQLVEFIKKLNFSHFKELNKTAEELKEMHIYIDCLECKMLKNTSSSPTRAELFSEDFNNTSPYKQKVQNNRFSIPKFVLSSNSDISDEEVILRTKKRKSVCVRKQEISSGSSRSSNDDTSDNDKTSSSDSVVEKRKSNSMYLNKQRNFNTTDDSGSSNNDNEKDDDKTSSLQSPDDSDNSVEEIKPNSIYLHKNKNFKNTVNFTKTDNNGSSDDDDEKDNDEISSLQSPDESENSVEEKKSNSIYLHRGRNFKNTVNFSKTNSKKLIFKIDNSGSSDDDDEKDNDERSSLQSPDNSDYSVEEIKSNSINLYKDRNLKNTVGFIERDKKQLFFKQGKEDCNSESDNEVNFNQETKHDTSESDNEDNSLFVPLKQICKSNNYSATECNANEEKIGMVKIVSLAKTLKSKNEENFETISNSLTGEESVHEFVLPKKLPSNIRFPETPKQSTVSNNQAKAVFKTPKSAVKDIFDRFTFKSVPGTPSYKRDFYKIRDQFVVELFSLFNKTVFDNKLPADLRITWNKRMTKTAGFCYYSSSLGVRNSSIELSDKVIDSTDRIRDTLIHELCHAAVWLLDGVKGGHGPHWKYWAKKGNRAHPDLPVISRCHQYEIRCKYKYKCDGCGVEIGRHSKSIDSSRHQCIRCGGTFELTNSSSASKRTPNAYAMFVKNNFAFVKKNNPSLSHKEVMMKISADFREIKLNDVDKENSNT